MDTIINTATNFILIKDMSDYINFEEINIQFEKLKFHKNTSNEISTNLDFFNIDKLQLSSTVLLTECKHFLTTVNGIEQFTDLKITNSWGNITLPTQMHHQHSHPYSVLSGVIYLDDNPSNLNFFIEAYFPTVPYYNFYKQRHVSLQQLIGNSNNLQNHLILFFSNMSHYVDTNNETTPRRSVAFNTFWKGLTGNHDNQLGSMTF